MKCPNCGFMAKDSDAFCQRCGCNLKATQKPPAQPMAPQCEPPKWNVAPQNEVEPKPVNPNAAQQNFTQPQGPATNIKVASIGVCAHCGKPFSPEGSGTYKLLKVLSVVVGIFFGFFALFTLINLLGADGDSWILALIFGAGLAAITVGKKKVLEKIDASPCPYCGLNKKGEMVGTPSPAPISTPPSIEYSSPFTPATSQFTGETKMCARCRAQNDKANHTCSECGFSFGKVVLATDGKNKFGLATCPGCGSVYQVQKNKPFIVIMALLSVVFLTVWMPGLLFLLNPLLAGLFITLAVMHAKGKLQFLSIKKCTVCHKTPLTILIQNIFISGQAKRDQALLNRQASPFTRSISSFNTWVENHISKANLFAIGPVISALIFAISVFKYNTLVLSWEGLVEKSQKLLYLDAVLNFGTLLQEISLLSLLLLFIATIITNFLPQCRLSSLSMFLGFLTGIVEIVLTISNSALHEFKYGRYISGERIVYDGEYPTANVNSGILLSALILVVFVFLSHMIEKEKRYATLIINQERQWT